MVEYQINISCERGKLTKVLRELADTLADERYVIGIINDKKYSVNIKEVKNENSKTQGRNPRIH